MKRLLICFILLSISGCALVACHQFLTFEGYLSQSEERETVLATPPPADDSPAARKDREIFIKTRALKDSQRWQQAIEDDETTIEFLIERFTNVAGYPVTRQLAPTLFSLFDKAVSSADRSISRSKKKYRRPRPFRYMPAAICAKPLKSYDYPSGHATRSWLIAFILADMIPDQHRILFEEAERFSESRVVCGLHNASSIEIAPNYANILKNKLYSKQAFMADFIRAKRELLSANDSNLDFSQEKM